METNSNNSLTFKHISVASGEILQYIDNRRKGIDKSLKTRWDKFNNTCNGGIEVNAIYTLGGISGSGKSAFINSVESDLFDLNPDIDFVILSLSFEMLSSKQVGRKLSYKLKKTTSELYNTYNPLSDRDYKLVEEESKKICKYPVFYVDTPGTVEEIKNTITVFRELYVKDKWLIVILDHALLTKGLSGESERATLFNLQRLFMEVKKVGKTTVFQLSQLNREIEEVGRITNPLLHFPQRRDIFGSDSLFHSSDYVMIIHRPEILQIKSYGPNYWPTEGMIYLHILKTNNEPFMFFFYFLDQLKKHQKI